MLEKGIVKWSRSPWASPVMVAPKKGAEGRMGVDFRRVNQVIRHDRFPLPRIADVFVALQNSKHFAVLDLKSGYYQIPIDQSSREITAFITKEGLYEFQRVPFGLKTAPAHFQRVMNRNFSDLLFNSCLIYLDDIIVFGRSEEEFVENLKKVLNRLIELRLSLNSKKCRIGCDEVEYLGFLINSDGRRIDPERIDML
ncbi:Retrovirus-related Pol polyprotein from transposon 297, partial [Aduncisulcus paluster]